jgi:hypothetical protein
LWRAAPFLAALCLIVAVAGRALDWPSAVPLTLLALALSSLAGYLVVNGRARPLSDRVAAAIDADASCGGELRSASWFAARQDGDPWTDLHLDRAADRLESIDWSSLYPPVRAVRAWAATALLVAATLVAAFVFPDRHTARASTPAAANESNHPANMDALPPELLKQLAELLDAAENGTLGTETTSISPAQMRDLIARLGKLQDRQALKELARKLEANRNAATDRSDQQMKALSERAKQAAALNVESREFREAMEGAESMSQAGLYGVSSFCGSIVALFIFGTAVSSEIRRGTIRVTLSKPVSRAQFLLGKYVGGVVVMLAYSVVISAAMILFGRATQMELAPAVKYAPWLMLWKNLMLGSVALLLSLFVHPLTAGVLAFFVNTYFLSPPNPLYFVLPSYDRFNVLMQIASGSLIKAQEVGILSLYALDFIILMLLLALWRFRSKELV